MRCDLLSWKIQEFATELPKFLPGGFSTPKDKCPRKEFFHSQVK